MDFGADDLVDGLRPVLAEGVAADVVHLGEGVPTVAQVGPADEVNVVAAVLLVRGGVAAVLDAVQDEIVVGADTRLAAKIYVVAEGVGVVILKAIGNVVAAIDSPEVSGPHHK